MGEEQDLSVAQVHSDIEALSHDGLVEIKKSEDKSGNNFF